MRRSPTVDKACAGTESRALSVLCLRLLCVSAGLGVQGLDLTAETFAQATDPAGGRTLLVQFYVPHSAPVDSMAEVWEQLGQDYAASDETVVGSVDCTRETELCGRYGVTQIPTLLVIADGVGHTFEGERTVDQLTAFVATHGRAAPRCGSTHKDLCTAEALVQLEEWEGLGPAGVQALINTAEAASDRATAAFQEAVQAIQTSYEGLTSEHAAVVAGLAVEVAALNRVTWDAPHTEL